MKLKNLIFDFGKVLADFSRETLTAPYVADLNDRELVKTVLFDRLYWDRLDAGTISDEELIRSVKERLPARLHAAAEQTYANWYYHLPEMPGMRDLIRHAKQDFGARVFILSNISRGFGEHTSEIPVFSEVEGYVLSALCGFTKPHAEIFDYTCRKFGLDPAETLFVDDSEKNIAGADAFGLRTYLFKGDVEALRRTVDELFKD